MSRRHRRHNRSKKNRKPSKNGRRQRSQESVKNSKHQTTPERTSGVNDHPAESQPFAYRLNRFLIQRKPRIGTLLFLLQGTVAGGIIGIIASFFVSTLHFGFDEPWPYLINGIVLLALEAARVWIIHLSSPHVGKHVNRIGSSLFKEQTGIDVPESQYPEVKWDFGKDAKVVVVATVGVATYLTANPSYNIEPPLGFDYIYLTTAAIGAIAKLLRGLSNEQVIQIIVKGKTKGQIEFEKLHQKGE